jgi:diguanylate cyclase (GGDEF)-like protein
LFNLDRFKRVNEGLGLDAGDELLRQVAARLKETLRDVDTVARLGADEFSILVESMRASADITAVAEKLIEAFARPFDVNGSEIVAVPSIGVTSYPDGVDDSQKLLEQAEIAMDRVKREGGGGYRLYDTEPATIRGGHLDLEMRLRHALERGELDLHYQPKVRLLDGAITGAEALLRWDCPGLGPVSPAKFIPVAEESGLIVPIGEWVLRAACAQMRTWHKLGHAFGIAVNLSPRQFRQKDLSGAVADALRRSGLAPDHLELEITEGTAMANAEQTVKVLGSLHDLGVRLSVDDFGTGYSSLSYLKRFPLDNLKIDRSFVLDVGNDVNGEAIVHATIALARSLKLKTIAEGVETKAQRDFLARAGCDEMQGYLFSRPLPAAEFQALITRPRASATAGR